MFSFFSKKFTDNSTVFLKAKGVTKNLRVSQKDQKTVLNVKFDVVFKLSVFSHPITKPPPDIIACQA